MQSDSTSLAQAVEDCLEGIVDPCSVASGAPAGLVSMGLVGTVAIVDHLGGASVKVTLRITEPGCMMGAVFLIAAQKALQALPGVASVEVDMNYGHIWSPDQMSQDYQKRLHEIRLRRSSGGDAHLPKVFKLTGDRSNA